MTTTTTKTVRVWDRLVRSLHWLLAVAVLVAWFSGHFVEHDFDAIHHTAGYLAGAVVALRVLWGFAGHGHARFADFVRGPRATWAYARELMRGREPRYLGHNPLGGWMVLALLGTTALLVASGLLYISDWLWGYEWLWLLHAALAWLLMALVIGHWGGVIVTGRRHRENLITPMFSGIKRASPHEGPH